MGINHDNHVDSEVAACRPLPHCLTVCSACGSLNVHVSAWVFANRDANIDTGAEGPNDMAFCPRCEDHVSTETLYRDDESGLWAVNLRQGDILADLRSAIRLVRECGANRRKAVQP